MARFFSVQNIIQSEYEEIYAYGAEISIDMEISTNSEGRLFDKNQEGRYVYILDANKHAKLVYIKTGGQTSEGEWIVAEGLKAGDIVITSGLQGVIPGKGVRIVNSEAETKEPVKQPNFFVRTLDKIKKIFESCRNKNNTFNFAAIGRVRTLVNLMYNDKNNRLDLPIKEFMNAVYEFSDLGMVKKGAVEEFCNKFAEDYARKESKGQLIINYSLLTMDKLKEKFQKLFKCLVHVGRASKNTNGMVPLERIELLWQERDRYTTTDQNDKVFLLSEFLELNSIKTETVNV